MTTRPYTLVVSTASTNASLSNLKSSTGQSLPPGICNNNNQLYRECGQFGKLPITYALCRLVDCNGKSKRDDGDSSGTASGAD